MKTPDYLSYEKYKKKKDSNPNKRLLIFISTFFITLLLFSVVVKSFSPDVDVTIGDESQTDAKDTGLGVKKFIDERLKIIQMEDRSSAGVSTRDFQQKNATDANSDYYDETQTTEEKISLPSKKENGIGETSEEPVMQVYKNPPRPSGKDLSTPFESPKMLKVYVGHYSTIEQAKVAQEILMDSGIDVTPFVKDLGGTYTLQIGSYSSKAKAEELASELRNNSFPARVVQE